MVEHRKIEFNRLENAPLLEITSSIYVFVMLVIFPLLMDETLYYGLTESKFNRFTRMTVIYIIATLLAFCITNIKRSERDTHIGECSLNKRNTRGMNLSLPQAAALIYMLWATASAISSDFGSEVLIGQGRYEGLQSLVLYGTAFVFISFWGEYSDIIPKGLALFGILEGLLVAVQLTGLPLPAGLSHFETGFVGTFGNIDCMGGIVALTVPAMISAYAVIEWKRRRLLLGAIYLMMFVEGYIWVDSGLVGLVASMLITLPFLLENKDRMQKTSAAFTALLTGMATGAMFIREGDRVILSIGNKPAALISMAVLTAVIAAILAKTGEFKTEPGKIRKYSAIGIVAFVLLCLLAIYMYDGDIRLLREASDAMHGEMSDSAGSGRGIVWKYCMELIPTVPILGTGPGTFYGAFAKYNQMLKDTGSTIYFDFAHNDFMQIAICLGIGGLIIYLVFISSLAINAIRRAGENPLILIFASGCAGYLVHSFFSFSIAIVTPGFWVMAGVLDNMSRRKVKNIT